MLTQQQQLRCTPFRLSHFQGVVAAESLVHLAYTIPPLVLIIGPLRPDASASATPLKEAILVVYRLPYRRYYLRRG